VKASVSKIKSKPIRLLIDEIVLEMEEPSVVLPPRGYGAAAVLTPEEEKEAAEKAAKAAAAAEKEDNAGAGSAPHRYALGDRVADGITVKVNRVLVVVRLKGPLKDAPPVGGWTPPVLVLEMKGLHWRSCDEGGDERGGDLRALWRLANQKAAEVGWFPTPLFCSYFIFLCLTSLSLSLSLF
jgi:hypothetical protein